MKTYVRKTLCIIYALIILAAFNFGDNGAFSAVASDMSKIESSINTESDVATWLIKNEANVGLYSVDADHPYSGKSRNVDEKFTTSEYFTITSGQIDNTDEYNPFITIDLTSDPLKLESGHNIVVAIQRSSQSIPGTYSQIITAELRGQQKGSANWDLLGSMEFIYRGVSTVEFSDPITPPADKSYSKLRFVVTTGDNPNRRDTYLNAFNLLLVKPGNRYTETWISKFAVTSDYIDDLMDYEFIPTQSILEGKNLISGYDPANNFDSNGKWTQDPAFLKASDITIPDYGKWVAGKKMPDGKLMPSGTEQITEFRQPTHVTEHVLYALPGDMITLTPYHEMAKEMSKVGISSTPDPTRTKYEANFSHWYNYRTGGTAKYLDFALDPAFILRSDKYGYYTAQSFGKGNHQFTISNIEDFNKFREMVNSGYVDIDAYLETDIDFHGQTIKPIGTADFRYAGTFDGKGHTLKNFVITNSASDEGTGLFGVLQQGAVIRNFKAINGKITAKAKAGLIGNVSHVLNDGLPHDKVTIENIYFYGEINADSNAGGILGCNTHYGNLPNPAPDQIHQATVPILMQYCGFEGTINDKSDSGILVGWIGSSPIIGRERVNSEVINCYGNATMTVCRSTDNDANYRISKQLAPGNYTTRTNCYNISQDVYEDVEKKDDKGNITITPNVLNPLKTKINEDYNYRELPLIKDKAEGWGYVGSIEYTDENGVAKSKEAALPGNKYAFIINSVDKYIEFVKRVNDYGHTLLDAKLTADLDFTGVEVTSIGTLAYSYAGDFDGGGHMISNITISSPDADNGTGLFGVICQGARIHDLTVMNGSVSAKAKAGFIGNIQNQGNVSFSYPVTVENIYFNGKIETTGEYAGGILGCNTDVVYTGLTNTNATVPIKIINCGFEGSVKGTGKSGALTGWIGTNPVIAKESAHSQVSNCYTNATVTGSDSSDSDKSISVVPGNNKIITNSYFLNFSDIENDEEHVTAPEGSDYYFYKTSNVTLDLNKKLGWGKLEKIPFTTEDGRTGKKWAILPGKNITSFNIIAIDDFLEFTERVNEVGQFDLDCNLKQDLDFKGWSDIKPIGNSKFPYSGNFNGEGHTVRNIVISGTDATDGTGLFGVVASGASIHDLNVINCSISAKAKAGLIGAIQNPEGASSASPVTIKNIYFYGDVKSDEGYAGGILGCNADKTASVKIQHCGFEGSVNGTINNTSGIIAGWLDCSSETTKNSEITNSYGNATLTGGTKLVNVDGTKLTETGIYNESTVSEGDETCAYNSSVDYATLVDKLGNGNFYIAYIECIADGTATTKEAAIPGFYIWNYRDYENFTKLVNDGYSDLNASLMADIDFIGKTPAAIGTHANPYGGYFDGNGYVLSNFKIDGSGLADHYGVGIFGEIKDGCTIKNVIVFDADITGRSHTGFIGCINNTDYTLKENEKGVRIHNIYFNGNVTSNSRNAGGILGCNQKKGTKYDTYVHINNCAVEGKITGTQGGENSVICGWLGGGGDTTPDGNKFKSRVENTYSNAELGGGRSNQSAFVGGSRLVFNDSCYAVKRTGIGSGLTTVHPLDNYDINELKDKLPSDNWYERTITKADGSRNTILVPCPGNKTTSGEGDETDTDPDADDTDVPVTDYAPMTAYSFNPVITSTNSLRFYGTIATFYCPQNGTGTLKELPADDTAPADEKEKDYIIAADFSQKFDRSIHINETDRTITEPVITFRHIFRIKDGADFAEEYSGSKEKNDAFIKLNHRLIYARAGHDFQIRLNNPVPQGNASEANFYYKTKDGTYDRVHGCQLKVEYISPEGVKTANPENYFALAEPYMASGFRSVENVTYNWDNAGAYNRMLKWTNNSKKTLPGTYIVKLIATDKNGAPITIFNSSDYLLVQEIEIHFLPDKQASLVSEEELNKKGSHYLYTSANELEKVYGSPAAFVTFDEYRFLKYKDDSATSSPSDSPTVPMGVTDPDKYIKKEGNGEYVKFPVDWHKSNYGFGYDRPYDYNMYRIANHSDVVPYKDAVKDKKPASNFNIGTGMFDRLFYDTKGKERGFFYYVNAAGDPGVMARLNIQSFCEGSTIYVSAWVAEFSKNYETANLTFNFTAITKSEKRILLNSFVTGYVSADDRGKWMHVYYSFIPDLSRIDKEDLDNIDHFEIELDNNCKNSQGADYAIDDINIFVVQPQVSASQMEPVCQADNAVDVKVDMAYEILMKAAGQKIPNASDENNKMKLYYTFVDKTKYDEELAKEGATIADAFDKAQLIYQYGGKGADDQKYGSFDFCLYLNDNPKFIDTGYSLLQPYWDEYSDGTKLLSFVTRPNTGQLIPGKEYILYLNVLPKNETIDNKSLAQFFKADDNCALSGIFTVKSANTVRIDGETVSESDDITFCIGQRPMVQAQIRLKKGNEESFQKDPEFDWYRDSSEKFEKLKKTIGEKEMSLHDALTEFRAAYPDATTIAGLTPKGECTNEILTWISELVADGKLELRKHSYIFPPIEKDYNYVTAVPIVTLSGKDEDGYIVCTAPSEIRVKGVGTSPDMLHGISEINYPDDLDKDRDIALRVGLRQLWEVSDRQHPGETKTLEIPLRKVTCPNSTYLETGLDPTVYLLDSDDPEYADNWIESTSEGDAKGEGASVQAASYQLNEVGYITGMTAYDTDRDTGTHANAVTMRVNDKFNFKEGYTYLVKFAIREGDVRTAQQTCDGDHVVAIKVVPEYVKWDPQSDEADWNNDGNWTRVDADQLYLDRTKEGYNDKLKYQTTSGTDKNCQNTSSFTPLEDYTKVIVGSDVAFPKLNQIVPKELNCGKWSDLTGDTGKFTEKIHYDITAYTKMTEGSVAGIGSRPWLANSADQIHFKPNSEIGGQQYLNYNKAWVDIETKPDRWYTLSSPLQNVVAGDMYLPTKDARQVTELFQPITFDFRKGDQTSLNDRFRPAVYQRSWNESSAIIYEIDGSQRNGYVAANWSKVYNDMGVKYEAGEGYSIKTSSERIVGYEDGDKVMFRLPKDDAEYIYYNIQGDTGSAANVTPERTNAGKLNNTSGTITLTAGSADNRYFLAGNPFMAHLDMTKFLETNNSVITGKYWLLNSDRQSVTVIDTDGNVISTDTGNPTLVPPMTGFFVEAKTPGTSLELIYDESMATTVEHMKAGDSPWLRAPGQRPGTRSYEPDIIHITATTPDGGMSASVIRLGDGFSRGYSDEEDAALLVDPQLDALTVYTVANRRALAINSLSGANGTEIGVMTPSSSADEKVTLTFEGAGSDYGYELYDAKIGEYTALYSGMRYEVEGNTTARLFLKGYAGVEDTLENGISISAENGKITVTSNHGSGLLDVVIYTVQGIEIYSESTERQNLTTELPYGVYVVTARDENSRASAKISIQ